MIVSLIFGVVLIAAVISYFYKRKKKLDRMGLQDKIDDMFNES